MAAGGGMRRRAFVAASVMAGGAVLAAAARPTRHLADEIGMPQLEQLFPRSFGDWRQDLAMPVVVPAPDVQALLDRIYNQTLARAYVHRSGERIMLSVAYGGDQSDGTSAHRPEVCYPAQGFEILEQQGDTVRIVDRTIPVRRLMARLGTRREPITYWVVVGGEVVTTGIGQKLAQMRHGLRGVIADGLLVRVSNLGTDRLRGQAWHDLFLRDLAVQQSPAARQRVFGDPSR